ncbi:MAG: nickel pincer cofactor biosynthesis protein LarB [Spirochaetaceae bacterium]|nr:nickel pincer cofactor biosynthesis protein LarB [Spirochaetaceae bacterium]
MTGELLAELLAAVRDGGLEVEDALERLRRFPVDASVAGARVDTHRTLRTGVAEVVFCPGKTPEQVAAILSRLHAHHGRALGTRATPELARQVRERLPEAQYEPVSRLLTVGWRSSHGASAAEHNGGGGRGGEPRERRSAGHAPVAADGREQHGAPVDASKPPDGAGGEAAVSGAPIPGSSAGRRDDGRRDSSALVAVVSAGTSDVPVAEEAARTLEFLGGRVERCYDVGVAGLHRLLAVRPQLERAAVVICVAGMEGALTSVVGGLLAAPVIGVPTSVGYGAHLGGAAPLLAMLNSCAAGVAVVNIDNGFGAALMAHAIIRQIEAAADSARSSGGPWQAGGTAATAARGRRAASDAKESGTS